jgi:Ca2+-binding RTX toxin-like protein
VETGRDLIVLGHGGNSTVRAGSGNATLVGGGDGDRLFGSKDEARQQLWASGNSTLNSPLTKST